MYKIIVTLVYGQFGQTLYQNMRKDFKYAQRLQAAFGRPKDPGAASGSLKVHYFYRKNKLLAERLTALRALGCRGIYKPTLGCFFFPQKK